MKQILETPRLLLREIGPEDAEFFFELNSDLEVMKYTGDKPFSSVEDARNFLNNYSDFKKYGMGRWAVIEKESNLILGWCGIKFSPNLNEYDIGYRFFKKYWNNGYATESAKACVEYGFKELNIKEIVGRAIAENTASIRVLRKIGLEFLREQIKDGQTENIYLVKNPLQK